MIISSEIKNNSDINLVKALIKKYNETSLSDLKQDIAIGLTSTRNNASIEYILKTIKNTSIIRTQDTARWIAYLSRNKYAKQQVWQWIRDNWEWINDNFGGDKSYDDYPRYMASALSTNEQLEEYSDFFGPMLNNPALSRVITIGINEIKDRVELIKRDSAAVREALIDL